MHMERSVYTRRSIDGWLAKVDDPVRSWLIPFRVKMEEDGLRPSTVRAWLSQARLFLAYLVEVRRYSLRVYTDRCEHTHSLCRQLRKQHPQAIFSERFAS